MGLLRFKLIQISDYQQTTAPIHIQLLYPTIMSNKNMESNTVSTGPRPPSPPVNSGQTYGNNANPPDINNYVALSNCLIIVLLHLCINLNTLVLRLNEYLEIVTRNQRGYSSNQAPVRASSSTAGTGFIAFATSSAANTSRNEATNHGQASQLNPADPPTPILASSSSLESATSVLPQSEVPAARTPGGESQDMEIVGAAVDPAIADTGAHIDAALGAGDVSAAPAQSIPDTVPRHTVNPDPDHSRLLEGVTLDDIAITDAELDYINAPSERPAAGASCDNIFQTDIAPSRLPTTGTTRNNNPPPNSPIRDNLNPIDDDPPTPPPNSPMLDDLNPIDDDPPPQYESDDDVISIITSSEGSAPRSRHADGEDPNREHSSVGILRDERGARQPREPSRESLESIQ